MKTVIIIVNMNLVWDYLDKAGIIIGLATFLFSILIWLKVRQQQLKLTRLAEKLPVLKNFGEKRENLRGIHSHNPYALCISLIPNSYSIKDRVDNFLLSSKMKMPTCEILMDGLTYETMETFLQQIREKLRAELASATEIHLFYQGPVVAAVLLGGVLDNWGPVKLYHYDKESGIYEYWGPLIKN